MNKIYFFLFSFLIISCNFKQPKLDEGIEAITYNNLEKHIVELSGDDYLGRKPMSNEEAKVLDYISHEMKSTGLDSVFFQEVPIRGINSQPSSLQFATRKGPIKCKSGKDFSAVTRKAVSESDIYMSDIVFVGFGITAPEYGRYDYNGIDVKGKTVLMFVNDPGYYTQDINYFKGHAMTYYGRWTYKFEEAARHGAKACFIIHETGPAGYPWSIVGDDSKSTTLVLDSPDDNTSRCDIEGWISEKTARKLLANCNKDFDDLKHKALTKDFKPIPLKAKATLNLKNSIINGVSKNIIGYIKGKDKPEEAVVYTAHWDHIGVVKPIEGDSIVNGATDNASAVSWLIEISRAFKKGPQPGRSIVFVATTAEESGLLGATYYTQHPLIPLEKTIAVINTDINLFIGEFNDVTLTGYGQSTIDKVVEEAAKLQGRYIAPDPNPENGMFFRSDHLPFVLNGVPALFAKGYVDSKKLGKDKTKDYIKNYWKNTYHKPSDEYHAERDDLNGLVQDTKLMYHVGWELSQTEDIPQWNDNSEFKK